MSEGLRDTANIRAKWLGGEGATPTVPSYEELREMADNVFRVTAHHSEVHDHVFNLLCEVRERTREAFLAKVIAGIEAEAKRGGLTFAGQAFLAELKDQHAK